MTPSDSPPRIIVPENIRFTYVPRPGLLRLTLVNAFLNLITLTIYRFWAKTNVRRHIWSCVQINGEPLEYTGRGIELFLGALIVFSVLGLPAALIIGYLSIAYGPEHPGIAGVQVLLFMIISVLWGAAIFKARRYQLSRTLWRGIRGGLEGSAFIYTLLYFGSLLARSFTFGWSTPALNFSLQEHMMRATRFGSLPFEFRGRAGPLYPSYALCWFLTAIVALAIFGVVAGFALPNLSEIFGPMGGDQPKPTPEQEWKIGMIILMVIGGGLLLFLVYPLIWSLYTAREMSLFARSTSAGMARFDMQVSAASVAWLTVGNFLLTVFTFGIARPYVMQRTVRFYCDRLALQGTIDIDGIRQSSAELSRTGEGLADAFDVGGL